MKKQGDHNNTAISKTIFSNRNRQIKDVERNTIQEGVIGLKQTVRTCGTFLFEAVANLC